MNGSVGSKAGRSVPQDDAEAAKWYRLAAEQGDAFAQNKLGYMYDEGLGVEKDYAEAAKWYRLAAEQNNAFAQTNLGTMFSGDRGVPQAYAQAYMWFTVSAGQGDRDAAEAARERVTNLMKPDQITEAEQLVRKWLEAHPQ